MFNKLSRLGKINDAITLNKNMVEIVFVMSSFFALIIGAAVAIAVPPHIDDPTSIKMLVLGGA